ncbi:legumain [Trichonephila inaurata madagascariensis]|uniref:Legumain n=1 Tax=Trichonephila inaurata madagascariensis TaxID=2747483 RepID=A0A8X7CMP4_9ARAC|nr:legumain [Trichonephila inaurata madagascariensis]
MKSIRFIYFKIHNFKDYYAFLFSFSGPSDHVFVYFADHGAPGLIAFPEDELSAKDLNRTINYMYENNMYGKMVIYIEACESGSMFENILPNNINMSCRERKKCKNLLATSTTEP